MTLTDRIMKGDVEVGWYPDKVVIREKDGETRTLVGNAATRLRTAVINRARPPGPRPQ